MRCAVYRRVSTDMQVEDGFSLDAQKVRLSAYVESQGWTITEDYCDEGYSAKNIDRPQMQRLIADIKLKKFDVILVYRLDRFVRSVVDLHELLQLMDKYDVKFKSATEVFDTTSATGRLFITMIATLAQWERETISERVHMGQLEKAEKGERNGAPAPYGYTLADKKLIINPDESKWVKYIFDRYTSVGSQTIAKDLNGKGLRTRKGEVWSDFSVRYVLKNPIYAGSLRWNYETTAKGVRKRTGEAILTHINQKDFVPIIDMSVYEEAQRILAKRSVDAFRSDNFYPFSSILKCESCGYSFSGGFKKLLNGKIHRFYKCRGKINFGICDVQIIAEETIEERFLELLEIADVEMSIVPTESLFSAEDTQKQLSHLAKKKERTKELYMDGDVSKDEYASRMADIRNEEEQCYESLKSMGAVKDIEAAKELLKRLRKEWHHFSHETKKQAVHSLFSTITLRLVEKSIPKRQKAKIALTEYELR